MVVDKANQIMVRYNLIATGEQLAMPYARAQPRPSSGKCVVECQYQEAKAGFARSAPSPAHHHGGSCVCGGTILGAAKGARILLRTC